MRNLFSKSRLLSFLTRAVHDKRGVTAVAFAITFAVLAPMSLGIFDVYTMTEQHGKLQDALDAATLYAARSNAFTTADVNTVGQKALTANLQLIPGASLQSSSFALVTTTAGDTKVVANAAVTLPAFAPMEFSHDAVAVTSEVTRPGNNLEVALVLDNTGSMAGSPMTSLQSAANQLIDLVVSPTQTPYYSKMAIVPYSNSVNAGSYATAARGILSSGQACGSNAYGCPNYTFNNAARPSRQETLPVTTCVSERVGTNAYNDNAPAGSPVGFVYQQPSSEGNNCISATIRPLSSDITALHSTIASLTANGSTAGHIGLAWGWYMISPNWANLFPSDSQGAAYGTPHLIKAVILMTDGDFNTTYCNGVISGITSATDGSAGSLTYHSNCGSPNGDSFTQAQNLCNAMKAAPNNIVIYSVGFLHSGTDIPAENILNNCATDSKHVYFPTTGSSLQAAFQAIAADLNKLRLSH
ncbi:MAG TPA: pilus assembly protein [Phenylobacterium sp.]|jgi:Flp pilus assembly protein TadG|uniref:pilus assembly protein n=1 Tax=Phenylobacterium sp. TaxID=1871053 RepID=UPI002D31B0B4|nr:pilus assembly protein [Phenylobacterium sp.]HZZ68924.1 pilus assembly protein [Phenylobacterium sp.]